ncbi:hypothetical protein HAX54_039142, partial [Datura stramonium]|nr:hypothetical protein [Datura stramonium]
TEKPHVLSLLSSPHQSTLDSHHSSVSRPAASTDRPPSDVPTTEPTSPPFPQLPIALLVSSSLISASPASRSRVDLHLQSYLSIIVDSSASTPPSA